MEQTHPPAEPVHGKSVRGLLDRLKDAGPLIALLCTVVGTGVAIITTVVMIGANMTNHLNAIDARLNAIDDRLHATQIEENRRFDAVQTKFDAIQTKFDAVQAKFDAAQIEENRRFEAINARLDTIQAEYNRQFDAINARLDKILEALRDHEGRISRLEERANPTSTE